MMTKHTLALGEPSTEALMLGFHTEIGMMIQRNVQRLDD